MSKSEKPLELLKRFLEKNYPEISPTVVAQILDLILVHRNMHSFNERMKNIKKIILHDSCSTLISAEEYLKYFGSFDTLKGGEHNDVIMPKCREDIEGSPNEPSISS